MPSHPRSHEEDKAMTLGSETTTVEIDETYVGGRVAGKGLKAAKAAKTIVLGIAERDGRIHLQTIAGQKVSNVRQCWIPD